MFALVVLLLVVGISVFGAWSRTDADFAKSETSVEVDSPIAPRILNESTSIAQVDPQQRVEESVSLIRISDAISGSILRFATIWKPDSARTQGSLPWIQADREGTATISNEDFSVLRDLVGTSLRCMVEFEARNPIVECRVTYVGVDRPGEPIKVELGALAGLRVQLSRESGILDSPTVSAFALPPIPSSITDSNRRVVLDAMRRSDAHAYLNELDRSQDPPERIFKVIKGVEPTANGYVVYLPFSGEVLVSVSDKQARSTSRIVQVWPGTMLDVPFVLREKSIISGRVLSRDGAPIIGVRVTVCVKTTSDPTEDFPRSSAEESSPGTIIITGENSSYPAQRAIYQQLSTESGPNGYYRIAMPYSDNVAAWVFDPEYGKGISSRDAPGRDSHVEQLDVYLSVPEKGRLVRLVDPDGQPIPDADLNIAQIDSENPYQVKLPTVTTDGDGFIDSWMLEPGMSYVVHVSGVDVVAQQFDFGEENEFRFARRWTSKRSQSN